MSREIRAGKAVVEVGIKSKVAAGMRGVTDSISKQGKRIAAIGGGIFAGGAAITAPLAGAVKHFASVGDEVHKMAIRSRMSTEELSQLGFAAEQSGTTMKAVADGAFRMGRRIANATEGTGPAVRALDELGISADELNKKTSAEQLEIVADALGNMEDRGLAAQFGFELLGDSFKALTPLLNEGGDGIRNLRREADDLGLTVSQMDADNAAKFGDAMNRLGRSTKALIFNIGAALAPALTTGVDLFMEGTAVVREFITENRDLVQIVGAVGVGLMVVGGAVASVGLAMVVASSVLGGLVTLFAAITSPIALMVGALIGGAVWFFRFSEIGQNAIGTLRDKASDILGDLKDTFSDTFGGITDAIKAGNLALAGDIAITGLQLAFSQGLNALTKMVGGQFGRMLGMIGGQLIEGDLSGAWNTVVLAMSDVWASFSGGVVTVFAEAAGNVIGIWEKTVNKLTNIILKAEQTLSGFLTIVSGGKITSFGIAKELERERELAKKAKEMGLSGESDPLFADIRAGTFESSAVAGRAAKMRESLEGLKTEADRSTLAAMQALERNVGGAAEGVTANVDRLKDRLAGLRREAADARAEADKEAEKEGEGKKREDEIKDLAKLGEIGKSGRGSVTQNRGAFSAAAVGFLSQGDTAPQRTAKGVEELVGINRKMLAQQKQQQVARFAG